MIQNQYQMLMTFSLLDITRRTVSDGFCSLGPISNVLSLPPLHSGKQMGPERLHVFPSYTESSGDLFFLLGRGDKKQTNMNVSELQKSFHLRWFLNIWKGSILILFPANYKIKDEDFWWQMSRLTPLGQELPYALVPLLSFSFPSGTL